MRRPATALAAAFALAVAALAALTFAGCSKRRGAGNEAGREGARPAAPRNIELIELSAPWNAACRMQAPVVAKLAKEYAGRAVVRVVDVDVLKAEGEAYGADSYPTFVFIVDGSESRRLVGLQSEKELRAALDEALR